MDIWPLSALLELIRWLEGLQAAQLEYMTENGMPLGRAVAVKQSLALISGVVLGWIGRGWWIRRGFSPGSSSAPKHSE